MGSSFSSGWIPTNDYSYQNIGTFPIIITYQSSLPIIIIVIVIVIVIIIIIIIFLVLLYFYCCCYYYHSYYHDHFQMIFPSNNTDVGKTMP